MPERDRRPYTGSVDQVIRDVAALAEVGVDEVILTLPYVARSMPELVDVAEEVHERFRAASI